MIYISQWPTTLCCHRSWDNDKQQFVSRCDVDVIQGALDTDNNPPDRCARVIFKNQVIGGYVPLNPIDNLIEIHTIITEK